MKRTITLLAVILLITQFFSVAPAVAARPAQNEQQITANVNAGDLLANLPAGSSLIVINFAALKKQAEQYSAQGAGVASPFLAELARIAAKFGISSIDAVDQLAFSYARGSDNKFHAVVLLGGTFDQQQILTNLSTRSGKAWRAKRYHGQTYFIEPNQGRGRKAQLGAAIAFFDNQSRFAYSTTVDIKRVIDTRAGAQPSILQDSALMTSFASINSDAPFKFVFVITDEIREKLAHLPGIPSNITQALATLREVDGSLLLNDAGLSGQIALVTGTTSEAAQLLNLINQGINLAKIFLASKPEAQLLLEVLDSVMFTSADNRVLVDINISADLLARLLAKAQSHTTRR